LTLAEQSRHVEGNVRSIGFGAALTVVDVWVAIVMARIEAQQGDAQAGPFLLIPDSAGALEILSLCRCACA
jgi:hypothetical protein